VAHIQINVEEFEELLGRTVTDEMLEQASMLGAHWSHVGDEKWDVEVYPNRPDLLSVEGLARAYRGFFGIEEGLEQYGLGASGLSLEVDDSVEEVRPHIGMAVVRGVELDERVLNGLIQLQEKLHTTLGRERDKIAIGLHDMEPLEPDFRYLAAEPGEFSFTPLEHDSELDLEEILEHHEKGQQYSWILEEHDRYPVIVDSEGQVLSFPPIINNQLTEVESGTEDVLIDVTGKDQQTVRTTLNILATALAERGGSIETVVVGGEELPDLSPRQMELDPGYFRSVSGVDAIGSRVAGLLEKMRFGAEVAGDTVEVQVPPYRTDVMHQYDLVEDAVIAKGYAEIEPERPEIDTDGSETRERRLADLLRDTMVGAGAVETHTFTLTSREKLFDRMDSGERELASMSNSLSENQSVVRDQLLPSLLEVLENNRNRSYPQRFFEVADVVGRDGENRKKLACVVAGKEVDYTDVRGILQLVERELGEELSLEERDVEFYRDRRAARVVCGGPVGHVGEISDSVASNWGLEKLSIAAFELDIEKLDEGF
jgi:phenylalanyl-tRNA synthetase beta chain